MGLLNQKINDMFRRLAAHQEAQMFAGMTPEQADAEKQKFRDEFNAFIARNPGQMIRIEPDCYCDVKRLASYGHDNGCAYMAWKEKRRESGV